MLPTLCRAAKAHHTRSPSATHVFKRSHQGLFGGKLKVFGNNVPESHQKTRRSWLPNIHNATLYSAALDERIQIKVTTSALRDIDKVGGLDQYLTKNTFQDVLGQRGQLLRARVLEARAEAIEKGQVGDNVKKVVAQLPLSSSASARRRQ